MKEKKEDFVSEWHFRCPECDTIMRVSSLVCPGCGGRKETGEDGSITFRPGSGPKIPTVEECGRDGGDEMGERQRTRKSKTGSGGGPRTPPRTRHVAPRRKKMKKTGRAKVGEK